MTSLQLDQLIADAPEQLSTVLGELHPHIREACAAVLEETQETEAKAKVNVALKITIDLSMAPPSWVMTGAVGITRKVTSEAHELDDPKQPELAPGMGKKPRGGMTSMTMEAGGKVLATITAEQAASALKIMSKGKGGIR